MGLGRNSRRVRRVSALRGTAMAMDVWYELRIREMSDVNEAANELVRDAEESASDAPDGEDEE
jgi:hypothetical protein